MASNDLNDHNSSEPLMNQSEISGTGDNNESEISSRANNSQSEISERADNKEKILYFSIKKQLRKPEDYLEEYDEYLMSSEDNSHLISLILRVVENKKFIQENCEKIMKFYAENESHLKNLFSILMFNWHEQDSLEKNYFLVEKFYAFNRFSPEKKGLFEKLFAIIDDDTAKEYHQICVKIIYYYFHKERGNESETTDDELSMSESARNIQVFDNSDIIYLINKVLCIKNDQYRIKILKILVVHLTYSDDASYGNIRTNIIEATKYLIEYRSPYKQSYEAITKYCDEKFFELAFYLKENLVMKFKVEFNNFIKMHKNYFGEFWVTAIKFNSQLLYAIAKLQDLTDTKQFLLIELNDPEIKSSPTIIFEKISEFQVVFNEPLDEKDEKLLDELTDFVDNQLQGENMLQKDNFKRKFKNDKRTFRLFYGRKDFKSQSLFEKIITMEKFAERDFYDSFLEILNYIWKEFGLKDKPETLVMKNFQEKRLIDIVLDTQNDNLFILFLMPEKSSDARVPDEHKLKQFMVLKNSLYYDYKTDENDKNLVDFNFKLIDKKSKSDYENWKNILYLFEEISQYNLDASKDQLFMSNLFGKVMKEKPENFNGKDELKLPKMHFLLSLSMIYLDFFVEFRKDENEKLFAVLCSKSNPNMEISKCETKPMPVFELSRINIEHAQFFEHATEYAQKHCFTCSAEYTHLSILISIL